MLERRCAFDLPPSIGATVLVALTSIHWREAWKYGERAFRYCQHDLGHAIAAVDIAAQLRGLRAQMLAAWSHGEIAALTGLDRDADYVDAEREEPGCILAIGRDARPIPPHAILDVVRNGEWTGSASQLSEDHVQWTFIDDIARETEDPGRSVPADPAFARADVRDTAGKPAHSTSVILERRSALAFDGQTSTGRDVFFGMLAQTLPSPGSPTFALWWDARIHLALFVHRVEGVDPGIYMLVRNGAALDRLREACGREFLWERAHDTLPLFLLHRGDCRRLAQRLSCDQEIAADGFFSLGMIADFNASLAEFGPSFYRHLFWESGVVGQLLYLAAESAGARGTGIGCFYDDPVHDVLGLSGHAFQSLYHFTIGMPVEDTRLMTRPGYGWET